MKITSTAISMQSQHFSMQRTEESESLTAWVSTRGGPASARGNTSVAAVSAAPSAPVVAPSRITSVVDDLVAQSALKASEEDWRLQLIKAFVEWLTGKPIKVFDAQQVLAAQNGASAALPSSATPPEQNAPAAPAAADTSLSSAAPAAPSGTRFGINYHYHASHQEVEQTEFVAQGAVTTADGRKIDFSLDLGMARSYSEETDVRLQAGNARRTDPLVVNTGNLPAQLSTQRVGFDLNNDGTTEQVPLLSGGAYLALDANQNGKIDSGAELFGPSTGSGFGELAKYDSDHNGWIDENDPIFKQLRLWKPDAASNGTLTSLQDQNVGAIFLGHQDTSFQLRGAANEDLGAVRTTGIYLTESGDVGSVQQIDLTA
jgi:hypothetical protein